MSGSKRQQSTASGSDSGHDEPGQTEPQLYEDSERGDFAYQAVYRYLNSLIDEVETDARVKLPSLRNLADRLNVSISTIQYAYSLLEKEGRVYSVAKSGYYALPSTRASHCGTGLDMLERLYIHSRRPQMRVLSRDEPAMLLSPDNPLLLLERELVRQYPRSQLSRYQPFGEPELRAALAVRYTSSAQRYWHADDVYIGTDLCGVLETLLCALALKNATVVVESPCDWMILRLLQAAGVRVIELPLQRGGTIDLLAFERILEVEPVRMMLMSSGVSLPMGCLVPLSERLQVARLLRHYDVWLLENDSYGELSYEHPITPMRELVDPGRLLVFSTFEKFMGSEAPFGYLLSRHFRPELQRHFLLRSFRLSPIRQKAIARFYSSGRIDQHLVLLRRLLHEHMSSMARFLKEDMSGLLDVTMPQGGITIWVRATREVDMRKVFERLLIQRIVVAPGELFSLQGHHGQSLRLGGVLDSPQSQALVMATVGQVLRQ